jgi:hypothetical protein
VKSKVRLGASAGVDVVEASGRCRKRSFGCMKIGYRRHHTVTFPKTKDV